MLRGTPTDSGIRSSDIGAHVTLVPRPSEDGASHRVTVSDTELLFSAHFSKSGGDLVLAGPDGRKLVLSGYFDHDRHADLVAPGGAILTADVVAKLTISQTPGQYAQAGAPAGAVVIGKVERLGGSATVQHANGTVEELKAGDPVYQGDVVETGGGSTLGMSFVDGTAFSMGAAARMVLSELVYDAKSNSNSGVFSLVKGTITFVAGKVAKTGDMRVETPVATMGIRGTSVNTTIDTDIGGNTVSVTYSLMRDPDGHVGSFNIMDRVTGAIIGTITTTDTKFIVTPTANLGVLATQLNKTPDEIARELAAAGDLFKIFQDNPANFNNQNVNPQNGHHSAGALGSLTASVTTDTSSGTGGVVTWNYTVADSAIQSLSAGQTKTETFTISLNDGHGTVTKDVTVTITGTNDAPVIDLDTTVPAINASLAYTENGASAAIAPHAAVTDIDSVDFNGGSLIVSFTANGTSDDQLAIITDGTVTLSGNDVSVDGVVIGTFHPTNNGLNGASLEIDFNSADATPAAVSKLMQHIGFSNSSDDPSALPRTVEFKIVDGDGVVGNGHDTAQLTATVNVTPVNDAPVAGNISASGSAAADLTLDGAVAFTDAEAADTHASSFVANGRGYVGDFTVDAVTEPNGSTPGSAGWHLAINAGDYSNISTPVTQSYDVTVTDSHNESATKTVAISIGTANGDTLDGANANVLIGGAGADTFTFHGSFGRDVVADFVAGTDAVELDGTVAGGDVNTLLNQIDDSSGSSVITIDPNHTITLTNVLKQALSANDFHFV